MKENQANPFAVMGYLVEESFGSVQFIDLATDYYLSKLMQSENNRNLSAKN